MMTRARMMTPKAKTPRTVAPLALATTVARMRQPRARARIRMMRPRARAKARARMVAPRPKARAKMVARPKARARMVAPRPKARAKMVARPKARAGWWHQDQRQKATGWDPDTRRLLGMFEVSVEGKHVLQKTEWLLPVDRAIASPPTWWWRAATTGFPTEAKKVAAWCLFGQHLIFRNFIWYICQWPPSIIWL